MPPPYTLTATTHDTYSTAVWKTRMHTELFTCYSMWLQLLRGMMFISFAWSFSTPVIAELSRPNVLLILSDDHSVPHVSCYDDPNTTKFDITPNLQKFAEQGMRFDRAYTTAPQCAPSRISIFACRSPIGLGVTRFAQPARADVPFFTDVLRAGGYWVGLDGRHHHLDGRIREAGTYRHGPPGCRHAESRKKI